MYGKDYIEWAESDEVVRELESMLTWMKTTLERCEPEIKELAEREIARRYPLPAYRPEIGSFRGALLAQNLAHQRLQNMAPTQVIHGHGGLLGGILGGVWL